MSDNKLFVYFIDGCWNGSVNGCLRKLEPGIETREEALTTVGNLIKQQSFPKCKNCNRILSRWGWYEAPNEKIRYWYCLECDKKGIEPCIQIENVAF